MITTQLSITIFSIHVSDEKSSSVTDESRFRDLPGTKLAVVSNTAGGNNSKHTLDTALTNSRCSI